MPNIETKMKMKVIRYRLYTTTTETASIVTKFCTVIGTTKYCPWVPRVGPGQSPIIPSILHLVLYLLVSFPFSISYSSFIYLLAFHPLPFYQNSPTPFPRCRRRLSVTLVLFLLILLYGIFS